MNNSVSDKILSGEQEKILANINDRLLGNPLISEQERQETLLKAREHVEKQRKEAAIDSLFTGAVREFEREHVPADQLVEIEIALPQFAAFLRLDNVMYFHGMVYDVSRKQSVTMYDMMARSWEHQAEINGRKRRGDELLMPRNTRISAFDTNRPANRINDLNTFQGV
jgi:hypothetical protein